MTFQQTLDAVLSNLAGVGITLAALVGVTYWLFKAFAERWLESRFSQRLEDHKHRQQVELENLRHQINKLMDRASTLQKFEFEVLPEIWSKLDDAFIQVRALASVIRRGVDLDRMPSDQLEAFLVESELLDFQKDRIRQAKSKSDEYETFRAYRDIHRARQACGDFHNLVARRSILLRPPIKAKCEELANILAAAIIAREHATQYPNFDPNDWRPAMDRIETDGVRLVGEIEGIISGRLWDTDTTPPALPSQRR